MSGVIINTGPAYAATKAAAHHLSSALGVEYAKDNTAATACAIGYILSGLTRD
jgi:NAD(P)-dependent dehydrogenase (short-subunit alcohol dehydrogenase family)